MSGNIPGDIARLIELFASGGWRDLRVQSQGISLRLSNDRDAPGINHQQIASRSLAETPATVSSAEVSAVGPASVRSVVAASSIDPAWTKVCAPNLGTFYRSPKPGAAPFVEVGQQVERDTEICLLEVMKLFTSVKAGSRGTIRKVCVEDGVLVEGGQLLFLIEAD